MSASTEDGISSDGVVVDGEDIKYGSKRPKMPCSNELLGSVDSHDRHLFLCYKSHEDWPTRVEDSESYTLPKLLSGALKAREKDISVKTRLTICEGSKETNGDVLIFPEMIKCRGLKDSDVDSFVEDVLMNGKPWVSGLQEVLTGSHIYVCAHSSRDKRCVVCGPALIDKFKEEIQLKEWNDHVFVSACSDVGGHKYAGHLIIFNADADGKIVGHWYGYVSPSDVPELLGQHIDKGEIIKRLWRGQMGAPVQEAEKVEEPIVSNENDLNITEKAPPQEVITEEKKEDVVSCLQVANFRDEASEVKPVKKGLGSREILTSAVVRNASDWQIDTKLLKRESNPFSTGFYSSLFRGEYKKIEVTVTIFTKEGPKYDFANEAACLRNMMHNNVVGFLGASLKAPEYIILTERMDGKFSDYLLNKAKTLKNHSQLVGFALDVSRGMQYLNENGIYHTDLCLQNLFIDDKKVLKVAGLEDCRLETPGSTKMQELQAENVYEFGVILWQMMNPTVEYPENAEIRRNVIGEDHHKFPPRLVALLRACLAANPSERPPFGRISTELERMHNAISADQILRAECFHKTGGCFCEH